MAMGHQFKKEHQFCWATGKIPPTSPASLAEMGLQNPRYQPLSPLALADLRLSQVRHSRSATRDRIVVQRSSLPIRIPLYLRGELNEGLSLPRAAFNTNSPVDQAMTSRRPKQRQVETYRREAATINYRRMTSINQTLLGLDNRAMEETHKKIFDILEGAPPQAIKAVANERGDTGEDDCIGIEKLKKVIRQLEREETWLHHFTNIIPVVQQCGASRTRSVQREHFLRELDKIHVAKKGFMSRDEFKLYNASMVNAPLVSDEDKKLLKYFEAIADAKKIYCFQTKLFVPIISLLLITVFLFDFLELMNVDRHLRFEV